MTMMTMMKRGGALILALTLIAGLLTGCSGRFQIKQNPDGSYAVDITESGDQGEQPAEGAEATQADGAQAANSPASADDKTVDFITMNKFEKTTFLIPPEGKVNFESDHNAEYDSNMSQEELVTFYKEKMKEIGAEGIEVLRDGVWTYEGKYSGNEQLDVTIKPGHQAKYRIEVWWY
jgi:hypothetical protein